MNLKVHLLLTMRKFFVFLTLLVVSLVSIVAVIIVGFYLFDSPPQSFLDGMAGMMGGTPTSSNLDPALIVIFVILIVVIGVGISGMVYFLVLPEIKKSDSVKKTPVEPLHKHAPDFQSNVKPYESVVSSLTKDEHRVLDVLVANDGKCPLEYLGKESGLTSVKTHRIVAKLAQKGIVLVGKSESKNEVQLTNWLHVTTGYHDLDALLRGGIPQGYSVMLVSSYSDERQLLIKRYLEAGIQNNQVTFYVTVDPGNLKTLAEQAPFGFYLFLCNAKADVIVKDLPNVFKLKGVGNLTDINIALAKAFRLASNSSLGPKRACIEIISDVLLEHHSVVTRKWLSELIPELRKNGFTTLAIVNPKMHSSEDLEAVMGVFEGEIRVNESETDRGLEKTIRVRKLYNQQYSDYEIPISKDKIGP